MTTTSIHLARTRRPLDNETCPYCGSVLQAATSTKEHVVGRRFVPKGKLRDSWNLIVRACRICNAKKSDLEDDLSVISLYPGVGVSLDDPDVRSEFERKAKRSKNRRTGKAVSHIEPLTIEGEFGPGFKLSFTAVGPPQPDKARVYELARLQLAGFFYLITYNAEQRRGGFWLGIYAPLLFSHRSDWGNPVHRWFMQTTRHWHARIRGDAADGYFRIVLRRNPEKILWSWGVEWNRSLRVIGFLGEEDAIRTIAVSVPELKMHVLGYYPDGSQLRIRSEVALSEEDDELFSADEEQVRE